MHMAGTALQHQWYDVIVHAIKLYYCIIKPTLGMAQEYMLLKTKMGSMIFD